MKLEFKKKHLSISYFDSVDLPDFALFTGVNGTGKTHIFRSISEGSIKIDDIVTEDIQRFNNTNFRISGGFINTQSIMQAVQTSWDGLTVRNKLQSMSMLDKAKNIHRNIFQYNEADEIPSEFKTGYWNDYSSKNDEEIKEKRQNYEIEIERTIFKSSDFQKLNSSNSIISTFKIIGKPIHLVNFEEFDNIFRADLSNGNLLSISIGGLITKYKVRQFLWAHKNWEKCSQSHSKPEMYELFEAQNPKPWEEINAIIDQLFHNSSDKYLFSFKIKSPECALLTLENYMNYAYSPKLIDRYSGVEVDFSEISSGEAILLALIISIYRNNEKTYLSSLILLDEIDASLHPSMSRLLIDALQSVFVNNNIKVIMASHSPATIALFPSDAIFLVNKGAGRDKIIQVTKEQAINVVSEGFITLNSGLAIFKNISNHPKCIITEGHNSLIIKHLLNLHNIIDVDVVEGIEAISSSDKLRMLFEFLKEIPHSQKVLFVWDHDYEKKFEDSDNTYGFKIDKNHENTLVKNGIENAFPESAFQNFTKSVIDNSNNEVIGTYFDEKKKKAFANHICKSKDLTLFSHFDELIKKIRTL